MVEISESAKFYSNIGLYYIVAKIKITKYNHIHQSCFSHCNINIINLLRSMSYGILCNGGGGGVHGVQNPHSLQTKIVFFYEKWKKREK